MFNLKTKPSGIGLINSTISAFERTKQQLQQGVELCQNNIMSINNEIKELQTERANERSAIDQAENVIASIDKLLTVKSDDTEEHS